MSTSSSTKQPAQTPEEQTLKGGETDVPSQHNPPLALPSTEGSSSTEINVGGEAVKLDAMGPVVVNVDGSLSRISNWDKMSEIEKRNTLRIIGKRNRMRREALEKAEQESAK